MAQNERSPLEFRGVPFTHAARPEWLLLPTDRFELIVERLLRRQNPHRERFLISVSLLFAFFFPLVTTSTYKPLVFTPDQWAGFTMFGTLGLVVASILNGWRWYRASGEPPLTAEAILAAVVERMTAEERREAERAAAASGPERTASTDDRA